MFLRSHLLFSSLLLYGAPALAQTTFVDVAAATGTTDVSFGRAAAMGDLDGDGLVDLVDGNAGQENTFFRQLPDRTFQIANALWGVPVRTDLTWDVLLADFDNDGDPDVYFGNGGFGGDGSSPTAPNQVLRNDISSTGVFVDVTLQSGAGMLNRLTFGSTAADYDRDGDLDLFCSNKSAVCSLLRNDGNFFFTDVSIAAGIVQMGDYRHAGSGDIDNDGWIDFGTGNSTGPNRLYHNQADGTFDEIAGPAGVSNPNDNFGMVFTDFDNDGWMDIYVPKYSLAPAAPSPLLLNQGNLTFLDVAGASGVSYHTDMGHDVDDIDGDGYPDLFIGTGNPFFLDFDYFYGLTPDGSGGLTATNHSVASGITSSGQTRMHGMAIGDYDEDGDLDVYCNNGGPSYLPATVQGNFFWQNQGNGNGWFGLDLTGVVSNRDAVGARTTATTPSGRMIRRYLAIGRGFGNTPDKTQNFGLGSENQVDRVDIIWPSGITQTLISPAAQAKKAVTETGFLVTGAPAIGTSVTFDFVGPPNELVDFNLALTQTSLQLADIDGLLELGGPITKLLSFALDAQGRASFNLPIPNNPNFIGITAYLQAWIRPASSSGTFTNTVALTIE